MHVPPYCIILVRITGAWEHGSLTLLLPPPPSYLHVHQHWVDTQEGPGGKARLGWTVGGSRTRTNGNTASLWEWRERVRALPEQPPLLRLPHTASSYPVSDRSLDDPVPCYTYRSASMCPRRCISPLQQPCCTTATPPCSVALQLHK